MHGLMVFLPWTSLPHDVASSFVLCAYGVFYFWGRRFS